MDYDNEYNLQKHRPVNRVDINTQRVTKVADKLEVSSIHFLHDGHEVNETLIFYGSYAGDYVGDFFAHDIVVRTLRDFIEYGGE